MADNFGFPGTGMAVGRGIGAGLLAGYQGWQQEQAIKRQQAQQEAEQKLRLTIAQLQANSREYGADAGANSRENVAGLQAQARLFGIQLTGNNQRDVANIRAAQQDRANQLASDTRRFGAQLQADVQRYAADKKVDIETARDQVLRAISGDRSRDTQTRTMAQIELADKQIQAARARGDADNETRLTAAKISLYGRLHNPMSQLLGTGDQEDLSGFLGGSQPPSPPAPASAQPSAPGAAPVPSMSSTPSSTQGATMGPVTPPAPWRSPAMPQPKSASQMKPMMMNVPATDLSPQPPPGSQGFETMPTPAQSPAMPRPRVHMPGMQKPSLISAPPSDLAPQPGSAFQDAGGDVGRGGVAPGAGQLDDSTTGSRQDQTATKPQGSASGSQVAAAPQAPRPMGQAGQKTTSRAEVAATAQRLGLTPQEVERRARAKGWTIVD